jgi:hypothetical protein
LATKVELPEIPAEIRNCPKLQSVQGRIGDVTEITDAQVKALWAQDRAVAAKCNRRHETLVRVYEELRADFAVKPEK